MVSLIIPAYNEEKRIVKTLDVFYEYMHKTFSSFEMIVVNDGSQDRTLEVLTDFATRMPNLKVLSYEKNRGKGGAVKFGVENATGDYIFFTDADMPYPIENIKKAIDIFEKTQCDAVFGSRIQKENGAKYPWYRTVVSNCFSLVIKLVLSINTSDTQCGFKGFKREAAKKIFSKNTLSAWGFDVEIFFIAQKHNMKAERIEVELFHNNDSKIKVARDSVAIFKELLQVRKNEKNGIYD